MPEKDFELFIHSQGVKPMVLIAAPANTLREILLNFNVFRDHKDELLVFVGECHESLKEPDEVDEGEDKHEPVDVDLTIEDLDLRKHRHIHLASMPTR